MYRLFYPTQYQSRSHGSAREEDTTQRRKIYLRILVTIAEHFLARKYWLLAVFTHRKLPFVTPGVKNLYEGDSKPNNYEEEVILN